MSTTFPGSVDAAVQIDGNYRFTNAERRKIDDQILALQQSMFDCLVNGVTATYATVHSGSAGIAAGDSVALAAVATSGSANKVVTKGVSAALSAAGGAFGVALTAGSPNGRIVVATAGAVGSEITGLALSAGAVSVNTTTGRLQTSPGTFAMGTVSAQGMLSLNIGGAGSASERRPTYVTTPIFSWRLGDGGSRGAAFGTAANSGSGTGSLTRINAGIYSGSPAGSILGHGCAFSSGGANSCLSLLSSTTMGTTTATIMAAVSPGSAGVIAGFYAGAATKLELGVNASLQPYMKVNSATSGLQTATSPFAVSVGKPTVVSGYVAAGIVFVLVDGIAVAATTATGNITYAGANPAYSLFNTVNNVTPGGSCITGTIEEVSFFDVALSQFDQLEYARQMLGMMAAS